MTRDYSQFLSFSNGAAPRPAAPSKLAMLGWQPFFAQQIDTAEMEATPPARVVEVHRNGLQVAGDTIDMLLPPQPDVTVGDWMLVDRDDPGNSRLLHRKSLFKRRAPGSDRKMQLIAANVETAFIVTSCNQDFNIARLERYVALALDADVFPLIVLTKADLTDDIASYVDQAAAISKSVSVVALNALSDEPRDKLRDWTKPGQTVVLLGSSGVGKSTLINALLQGQAIQTAGIREDDAKGRHTTTSRQLYFIPGGCGVIDTPGMRELQLTDARDGIDELFDDISALADQCRFSDCQHDTEPGCAIRQAVDEGRIAADRLARWQKLMAEERFNSATLAERKAGDKALHKRIRAFQKMNRK